MKWLLIYIMNTLHVINPGSAPQNPEEFKTNKTIPPVIEASVLKALSHYPQLKNTNIRFIFKKNIKGSVMLAQPVFSTLLKKRKYRKYRIYISSMFKLTHSVTPIHQLPDDILIGWIGHELGHIMDYESRSNSGMVTFGYKYVLSGSYVKSVEVVADTYAVNHGLGKYIIATKRFILDHAELPESYKAKIAKLYLSPDDIVEQVRKLEERKTEEQKTANK